MRIDLSGRTAVVTGSTGGIGLAIAKGLAEAGATVVVNGRTQARVDAAVAQIGGARGVAADLATAEGVAAFLQAVPAADVLVNNLGIFELAPFGEITDADWLRFFETNVMSGVRMSRAYLPGMVGKGWGRVVFISSESGLNIPKEMIHYGMTKTAQLAIARGLAESVAGTGVTVNSVLPGPTLSEGVTAMLGGGDAEGKAKAFVEEFRPSSLLRRAATVEEVANMVVYACSPQASATSGAALRVDGGVLRHLG